MNSLTLSLSGNSSILNANYFPPIDLSDGEYVCGLIDFQTFNTIPNVDINNNRFHFGYGSGQLLSIAEESSSNDDKKHLTNVETDKIILNNIDFPIIKSDSLYYDVSEIRIPVGSYEIEDINTFLKKNFASVFGQLRTSSE